MESMLPICRVCLKTSLDYVNLESAYKTNQTSTLMNAFSFFTNINVKVNDNLSRNICCSCCNELRVSFEFIQKAQISDQKLKCINHFRKLDNILNQFNNNKPTIKECDSELDDLDGIFMGTFTHPEKEETNEMEFQCFECDKKFKSKYVLGLHVERNHKNCTTIESQESDENKLHTSVLPTVQNEEYQQIYYQPTVIHVSNKNFTNHIKRCRNTAVACNYGCPAAIQFTTLDSRHHRHHIVIVALSSIHRNYKFLCSFCPKIFTS